MRKWLQRALIVGWVVYIAVLLLNSMRNSETWWDFVRPWIFLLVGLLLVFMGRQFPRIAGWGLALGTISVICALAMELTFGREIFPMDHVMLVVFIYLPVIFGVWLGFQKRREART